MAPRKLSDSDKQQITRIYCQPGETTSTLANQFGVSSSTVSRVLKQVLSEDDYTSLMQWKRGGERNELTLAWETFPIQAEAESHTKASETQVPEQDSSNQQVLSERQEVVLDSNEHDKLDEPADAKEIPKKRPRRSRSRTKSPKASDDSLEKDAGQLPLNLLDSGLDNEAEAISEIVEKTSSIDLPTRTRKTAHSDAAAWVTEGLKDTDDEDLENPDDYDEEDDHEDWEDENWEDESSDTASDIPSFSHSDIPSFSHQEVLSILSFDEFTVRKPCYLVVDRLAELITCPLKEFSELGQIPFGEEQARTLPVFDNHRIARRFARRNQRIIKVPSGALLSKTQSYLQAKGITRILFDGRVYALK